MAAVPARPDEHPPLPDEIVTGSKMLSLLPVHLERALYNRIVTRKPRLMGLVNAPLAGPTALVIELLTQA